LSKGLLARHQGFDKLSPNGRATPFALSLSKGLLARHQGFDKLSPNGAHHTVRPEPVEGPARMAPGLRQAQKV